MFRGGGSSYKVETGTFTTGSSLPYNITTHMTKLVSFLIVGNQADLYDGPNSYYVFYDSNRAYVNGGDIAYKRDTSNIGTYVMNVSSDYVKFNNKVLSLGAGVIKGNHTYNYYIIGQ